VLIQLIIAKNKGESDISDSMESMLEEAEAELQTLGGNLEMLEHERKRAHQLLETELLSQLDGAIYREQQVG